MSKVEEAIKKVNGEMENTSDECLKIIGEMIIELINENTAEKVLEKGENISDCFKAIQKEAKGKTKKAYAAYAGEKGYKEIQSIIIKYFGIEGSSKIIKVDFKEKVEPEAALDIDLDSFLE